MNYGLQPINYINLQILENAVFEKIFLILNQFQIFFFVNKSSEMSE